MKKTHFKSSLIIPTFVTLFFLCLLFIFPSQSLEGAKKGLLLWFQIVLPTLLPFFIVSNLMVALSITDSFSLFLYPILKHIMPIHKNGCYPIAIGLLSGYPIGAKACSDMVSLGKISPTEGQFLLTFCNNASPMFLLNYVFLQSLKQGKHIWVFMGILYLSAFLSGYLFLFFHHRKNDNNINADFQASSPKQALSFFQILDTAIMNSFEVITKVGGYIILFSLLANLFVSLFPVSELIKTSFLGALEITTGIQYIADSTLPDTLKILVAMPICAFGGLSSVAQTNSVILNSPLKISLYLLYKLFNSIICLLLTYLYLTFISL